MLPFIQLVWDCILTANIKHLHLSLHSRPQKPAANHLWEQGKDHKRTHYLSQLFGQEENFSGALG